MVTEVYLSGLVESEGPGHVGLAAVSGFDDAEVPSVLDSRVTLFFCFDHLSAFARFYCVWIIDTSA